TLKISKVWMLEMPLRIVSFHPKREDRITQGVFQHVEHCKRLHVDLAGVDIFASPVMWNDKRFFVAGSGKTLVRPKVINLGIPFRNKPIEPTALCSRHTLMRSPPTIHHAAGGE